MPTPTAEQARKEIAMSAKHTPGEWRTEVGTTLGCPIDILVDGAAGGEPVALLVARVYDGSLYDNDAMKVANARLIVAAPALLKALTDQLDHCGVCGGTGTMAMGKFTSNPRNEPCPACTPNRAALLKAKGA